MKVAIVGAGKLGIKVANALFRGRPRDNSNRYKRNCPLQNLSADGRHDCQRQRKEHKVP